MSWKTNITYALKDKKSSPSVSTEQKTVSVFVTATGHPVINGVEQESTYTYVTTQDVEKVRTVTTTANVEIYESTGFLTEAAANDAVYSSGWVDIQSGTQRLTEVGASKAAGGNGWKLTKTVTEITIARGQWVNAPGGN